MSDQYERPEDTSPQEWARLRALPSEADRLRAQGFGGDPDPEEDEQVALHITLPGLPDDLERRVLLARFVHQVALRTDAGGGHPVAVALAELAAEIRSQGAARLPGLPRQHRELVHQVLVAGWQRARAEFDPVELDARQIVRALEDAKWAPKPDPTTARRLARALGHSGPLDT